MFTSGKFLQTLTEYTAISMLNVHLIMYFGRKEQVSDDFLESIIMENTIFPISPAGQHWVVFYQSTGNNYLINDPWYGSGLSFHGTGGGTHEYYSYSDIGNVYVLN